MVIYIIEFLDTDYFYIGSTINYKQREYDHFGQLKKNKHVNSKLQNVFNKYPDKFIMRVIDSANTHEKLLELEQSYIDTFQPSLNMSKLVTYPTGNRPSKMYEVVSSEGVVVKTNKVLEFCEKNNIDFTDFYKVVRGQRCSCKGWKILTVDGVKINQRINKTTTDEYKTRNKEIIKMMHKAITKEVRERQSITGSKRYLIKTPSNIQLCAIGLNYYCRQEGLNVSNLAKVAQGKAKHHKGYWCKEIQPTPKNFTTPKVGTELVVFS